MRSYFLIVLASCICVTVYAQPAAPQSLSLRMPPPTPTQTPPAGWTLQTDIFGGAVVVNSCYVSYIGTTFTVSTDGGSIFFDTDDFCAPTYATDTTSDYTLIARVVTHTQVGGALAYASAGPMIRETLAPGSQHVWPHLLGINGELTTHRETTDADTTYDSYDASQKAVPRWYKIEVDRALESVRTYWSTDGSGWTLIDEDSGVEWTASGLAFYLLLASTPNVADEFATTNFDNVSVSTAGVNHSSGDVGFSPTSYSPSEEAGTVTVTVARTGSTAASCSLNYVVNDGTAVAVTDYTDESGTFSMGIGVSSDTEAIAIIDRNAVTQGNLNFTVVASIATCTDGTLGSATATVTIQDQDAGSSWTANTPSYTPIIKGQSGQGLDWTSFLSGMASYEIVEITNLNTSGAGSERNCLEGVGGDPAVLRFCLPRVSGMIDYQADSYLLIRGNLVAAYQTAPSPGLCSRGTEYRFVDGADKVLLWHMCHFTETWPDTPGVADTNTGSGFNQATDTGVSNDIVYANLSQAFNSDEGFAMYRNLVRGTVLQSMCVYPVADGNNGASQGLPATSFCSLLGGSGTVDDLTFARNVCIHARFRCPASSATDVEIVNNVVGPMTDGLASLFQFSGVATQTNFESNLSIHNGVTCFLTALRAFDLPSGGAPAVSGTTIYMAGNQSEDCTDTTQADLLTNDNPTAVTVSGSRTAAHADGLVPTPITAGATGEAQFRDLVYASVGARPTDRLPFFQAALDAAKNGTGNVIDYLTDHPTGIPSVANNTCNLSADDSCGTGGTAIPFGAPKGAGAHIDATWTALMSHHCKVMPAGATGC